jgi:hypothetical protein
MRRGALVSGIEESHIFPRPVRVNVPRGMATTANRSAPDHIAWRPDFSLWITCTGVSSMRM